LPALAFAIFVTACQVTRPVQDSDRAQIEAAMQAYSGHIRQLDAAAIADGFTVDGEMSAEGMAPVRGRAAIRAHLQAFEKFKVSLQEDVIDSIVVDGDHAELRGAYHQQVILPDGRAIEVRGRYRVDWLRDQGRWRMRRMQTMPAAG
jgi:uncharacterized protein (TIGR02246 family)